MHYALQREIVDLTLNFSVIDDNLLSILLATILVMMNFFVKNFICSKQEANFSVLDFKLV